jgi:ubiquinone/menaquinone biosynthesis C-methylase UbiE
MRGHLGLSMNHRLIVSLSALLPLGCPVEPTAPPAAPLWAQERAQQLFHQAEEVHPFFSTADLASQLFKRHTDPERLVEALALEPGMTVADIGAGVGWFTFRLAEAVGPEGVVHALDVQPRTVALLEQRAERMDLDPHDIVRVHHSAIDDTTLPPASVDRALMAHLDFYLAPALSPESQAMLASSFATLRPGGRLVVAQVMRPGDLIEPLPRHFAAAGFEQISAELVPRDTWIFVFERPNP